MKTMHVETPEQWRKWLADHHNSESEAWLVFHKHHTGRASITYEDAVCAALSFGWVDSLIKRLDDARYARKFTPRKPDSKWSDINRQRYARLKAGGQLAPAGLSRPPTKRTYGARPSLPATVPNYIQEALQKRPAAWRAFERLAPSHRRRYVGWIDFAKQHETKMRRLQEAIDLLTAGKKLGLK
jgi:uncharacterized protein YdeI (YjbR/CyaY-like superfamily)